MNSNTKSIASSEELDRRSKFYKYFESCPVPKEERLANSGLFVKRQELTKTVMFYELYKQFINTHGVIMEFGVRWGQNLVALNNLRGMLEPYNYSRKIIGFDTFSGFPSVDRKDGGHEIIREGAFSVTEGYENYLGDILRYHEEECPLAHVHKNLLVKGDASVRLKEYLERHPETVISFAWFDFDIYEPTLKCLELIKPHVTKGTVIGFDEVCDPHFPGETVALREAWGTNNISLRRFSFGAIQSYFIVE